MAASLMDGCFDMCGGARIKRWRWSENVNLIENRGFGIRISTSHPLLCPVTLPPSHISPLLRFQFTLFTAILELNSAGRLWPALFCH